MVNKSLTVTIAGRTYPLNIEKSEDEQTIHKAIKIINERVKTLEQSYTVNDKQDLLSMALLQFVSQNLQLEERIKQEYQDLSHKLEEMENFVSVHISKS